MRKELYRDFWQYCLRLLWKFLPAVFAWSERYMVFSHALASVGGRMVGVGPLPDVFSLNCRIDADRRLQPLALILIPFWAYHAPNFTAVSACSGMKVYWGWVPPAGIVTGIRGRARTVISDAILRPLLFWGGRLELMIILRERLKGNDWVCVDMRRSESNVTGHANGLVPAAKRIIRLTHY